MAENAPAATASRSRRNSPLWWGALCIAAAGAGILGTRMLSRPPRQNAPVIKAALLAPPKATFSAIGTLAGGGVSMSGGSGGVIGSFAISPDNTLITFTAVDEEGRTMLWTRRLDGFTSTPLRDTDGASYPFFSPDGKSIGFFADGKLKKISVDGGVSQIVCDAPRTRGGTWNRDGVILYTPTSRDPIYRVDANRNATPLTTFATGEFTHRWPFFLPDGDHFVYMAEKVKNGGTDYSVYASSLAHPEQRVFLLNSPSQVYYSSGYLLFARDKVIFAQHFDPDRLRLSGDPVAVAEDVQYVQSNAQAMFTVSDKVLAYQSGAAEASTQIAWLDRSGRQLSTIGQSGNFGNFRISPDGTKVALSAIDPRQGTEDVWIYDLVRETMSRVSFAATWSSFPIWSADGRDVFYRSARTGPVDLYRRSRDGAGGESMVVHSSAIKFSGDSSPDGKWLAYYALDPRKNTKFDIRVVSLVDGRDEPYVQTEFNEGEPAFSPDGQWIAYVSDETGRNEVYLGAFPTPTRKVQVSTNGGTMPRWRGDGKELFYLAPDFTLTSVQVGPNAQTSPPKGLFKMHPSAAGVMFDVASSGDRFLVGVPSGEASTATISLVVNWSSELSGTGGGRVFASQ